MISVEDRRFMRLALAEARRALGRTAPNPMVGCVIVSDGKIVARGFHARAGEAHAEVDALRKLSPTQAPGATVYVTLEPCNHHGRTPPCTEALVAAGIARVVVAMRDPHRIVDGRGIERLRAAGIAVDVGVLEAEARALNAGFVTWVATGRPRVTLKAAVSLDGKLATRGGDSRWVTGARARREAHRLRDASQAILVGVGTAIAHDPALTVRLPGRPERAILRVVLDGKLRTPPSLRLVAPGTLFVATLDAPVESERALAGRGAEVLRLPAGDGGVDLAALLDTLGRRDVLELLVEGGGAVHAAFLRAGLADRVVAFVAPKIVGQDGVPFVATDGPAKMSDAVCLEHVALRRLGNDTMIVGDVVRIMSA